jgi:TP901 family phage tail tape measure protein
MADDKIRQEIETSADVAGLNAYAKAANTANTATTKLGAALTKLNQAGAKASSATVTNQIQKTGAAAKTAGKNVQGLGRFMTAAGKSAKGAKAQLSGLSAVMTRLTRIAGIQLFLRGLFDFQSAVRESIQTAGEFERALAEIRTISGDSVQSFERMTRAANEISAALGVDRLDLAAGAYQALSAQVVGAEGAFDFVRTAAELATATLSTTKESVDALASVINSFGLSSANAEQIAGKLFKTIELGRVRMGELSRVIGRVAPLGAQLGASLDEVLAGVATLTQTGVNAAEAGTLLSNVMLKMIKPTDELSEVFKKLNVSSGEALVAQEGLQGAINAITDVTGKSSTAIGKLFGRVRAIRGIMSLAGKQAEAFTKSLQEIEKAGARDLKKAVDEIQKTEFQQLQRSVQELKNAFIDTFGTAALQAVNKFFAVFGTGEQLFRNLKAAAIAAMVGMTAAIITASVSVRGAFGTMTIAALRTAAAAKAAWIAAYGPAGLAVVAVTAGIAVITKAFLDAKAAAEEVGLASQKRLEEANKIAAKNAAEQVNAEKEIFNQRVRFILQLVDREAEAHQKSIDNLRKASEIIQDDIANQVEAKIKGIEGLVTGVRDAVNEARIGLAKLPQLAKETTKELAEFDFEVKFDKIQDDTKKVATLIRESNKARQESFNLARRGLEDEARKAREAAQDYAERARTIADGSDSITDQNKAIRAQRQLIKDAVNFERQLQQARLANSKEAGKTVAIKETLKETNELQEKLLTGDFQPGEQKALESQLEGKLEAIARAFQKSSELGLSLDKLGFGDLGQALKIDAQIFDPITGQLEDVGRATLKSFKTITNAVKAELESINPILVKFLERVDINIGLAPDFARVKDEIISLRNTMNELREPQTALRTEQLKLDSASRELGTSLRDAATAASEFNTNIADEAKNREATAGIEDLLKRIELRRKSLQGALEAGDTTSARENIKTLLEQAFQLKQAAQNIGDDALGNIATAIIKQVKQIGSSFNEISNDDLQRPLDKLIEIQNKFKAAEQILKAPAQAIRETGPAATQGASVAISQIGLIEGAADSATDSINQMNLALAGGGGGGGGNKVARYGGFPTVFRQSGGLASTRGLDRSLVAMDPREFVMSARATRNHFPQLQAANAQAPVQFKEQGGSVHTEIGNINFNITESDSPRQSAREAMNLFNREMRRQTGNLRGR